MVYCRCALALLLFLTLGSSQPQCTSAPACGLLGMPTLLLPWQQTSLWAADGHTKQE